MRILNKPLVRALIVVPLGVGGLIAWLGVLPSLGADWAGFDGYIVGAWFVATVYGLGWMWRAVDKGGRP